jgi:hypothetical protein
VFVVSNSLRLRRFRPGAASDPHMAGPLGIDLSEWRAVVFACFRPGGAHPFIGVPVSAIDDPLVELEAL